MPRIRPSISLVSDRSLMIWSAAEAMHARSMYVLTLWKNRMVIRT
jgi:hypothetical protein